MMPHLDTTKNLCKIIAETFQLPTFFINLAGEIPIEFTQNQVLNPFYQNEKQNLFNILNFDPNKPYKFPVIKKTYFLENYLLISVMKNNQLEGTILIGPSISFPVSEQKISGIINDFHVFAHRELIFNYYESIPIIQNEKLLNICVLIFQLFNHIFISPETVMVENKEFMQTTRKINDTFVEISKTMQFGSFHHDPLLEKRFLHIIKEGKLQELKNFTGLEGAETGVLSKSSYIRSKKNLCIASITLATRAAIDGGLHSEVAFTLSDIFIQRLEDLKNVDKIDELMYEAILTFTEKVLEVKEQRYSKTITTVKNYIYNHKYEKINHAELANAVNLNPSYLSVLFKEEVGIPVSEYIQQIKIDEAKNLLAYTDTPLSEISSLFHFTDQSHFTKVFKKLAGITPKQFKEKHHLIEK